MDKRKGIVNVVDEWTLKSQKQHANPFSQIDLDAIFTSPENKEYRIPAFWAGGNDWKFRFAAPQPGTWKFKTICSDSSDIGLHAQQGDIVISSYNGRNPLYLHGRIQIAENKRYFVYADGTPFFWLGDTWWMALTSRLPWENDFAMLTKDRVKKGFNVIQLVAGLYPDMPYMDHRGANEAGFPYDKNFDKINPEYYDVADRKVVYLIENGLSPCIVGCWGYYLTWMGVDKMKKHWRYLVARYGAYPVIWCLAGEATMPYYLYSEEEKEEKSLLQKDGWTELGKYVRSINSFNNIIGVHPIKCGRNEVNDDSVMDFDMLQTGHCGYDSIPSTMETVSFEHARKPHMPVVESEVNYEGIFGTNKDDVQRLTFWTCIFSGASGYTYGANGLWQLNDKRIPYGPSPHGSSWGDTSWQEAYQLPGSSQIAKGASLMRKLEWWNLEQHPEWIYPCASKEKPRNPRAIGISGQLRIFYLSYAVAPWNRYATVKKLEDGFIYEVTWIDAETGRQVSLGKIEGDIDGSWQIPQGPTLNDAIIIMKFSGRKYVSTTNYDNKI